MTREAFETLDEITKTLLQHIAYLSHTTRTWIIPPDSDPAYYNNHNPNDFNVSVSFEPEVSKEPLFRANRDIKVGNKITSNYTDLDENSAHDRFK